MTHIFRYDSNTRASKQMLCRKAERSDASSTEVKLKIFLCLLPSSNTIFSLLYQRHTLLIAHKFVQLLMHNSEVGISFTTYCTPRTFNDTSTA